jgi:glutamate/tyrosine decarboxylase-like PLP-dependent enzyme
MAGGAELEELAHELEQLVERAPDLEMMAPVVTNIVCFRYNPGGLDLDALNALNEELVIQLHEGGIAAPSYTTLEGRYCLRAALANHRTRSDDLPIAIEAVRGLGARLADRVRNRPVS